MKRIALTWLAFGLWGMAALSAAEGLAVSRDQTAWPQWQARLSLSTYTPAQRFAFGEAVESVSPGRLPVRSGVLLGDYYFSSWRPSWLAPQGGFRATSGLMVGTRSMAAAEPAIADRAGARFSLAVQPLGRGAPSEATNGTVPYLGIGYTGLWLKGGWGVSADLGLTAENPAGAARFGRALFGNQGTESALRELRLSPLLQLGVSYSF